ncbi:MAG TPA: histidine phosphatase family protein [Phycisphaerae bacterium]|nr:histidine phosphatase family protein [Phycisphaerae bacterium]
MKKLIFIRAGRTEWDDQERIAGDTDLDLNEQGRAEAGQSVGRLVELHPKALFCGSDNPARETARIIGEAIDLKAKALDELREMDLGHWEGLTADQFAERFPKVNKAWRDDPASVEAPDGEALAAVEARLDEALGRIFKRKTATPIVMVLGRLAFAAARCKYTDGSREQFWEHANGEEREFTLTVPTGGLIAPGPRDTGEAKP